MAANFLHGVETIEIDRGPRPIRGVKTAVVGLVGTAPIFEVDAADRTVGEPVLVTGPADAARYFGGARDGYTIPQALDAIFDQGRGLAVVVNVLDPATHRTVLAPSSFTFDADGTIALPQVGVSAVTVTSADGNTTHVEDTDYAVDYAEGTVTRIATGAIAEESEVLVGYTHVDAGQITAGDVIGGTDGAGGRTGMKAFEHAYNLFGFAPKILIAPGYADDAAVATELDALAHTLRAIALVDAPKGISVTDATAGRGPDGTVDAFNSSSERRVLCYPHVKRYDAATDADVLEPMSQRLAGVICRTDYERGYWWSPSNQEIRGITGAEKKLSARINDATSEVNLLNEAGITTLFNSFGTGLRTWGNRSAAWPSVTHPKNFINIRRTADVIHESVEYSMLQFLDRPINDALIDDIRESVNAFLRTLVGRGALIDGRCLYDPAKNPPTEIALGHLTFDVEFMPPVPAERITFESFININLLQQLGGGAAS